MNFRDRQQEVKMFKETEIYLNGELRNDIELQTFNKPITDETGKITHYKKLIYIKTNEQKKQVRSQEDQEMEKKARRETKRSE